MTVTGPDGNLESHLYRLMAQYERELLRTCYAILQDRQLAEDAVQETFLKAYRHLSSFREESSEKTWLMRIAINVCKDQRRSRYFRFMDRRLTPDELPDAGCTPQDTELSDAVLALPHKQKEAVLLYYYQGMTLEETAAALGIRPSSVSLRLKRARTRLKSLLEGDDQDENR